MVFSPGAPRTLSAGEKVTWSQPTSPAHVRCAGDPTGWRTSAQVDLLRAKAVSWRVAKTEARLRAGKSLLSHGGLARGGFLASEKGDQRAAPTPVLLRELLLRGGHEAHGSRGGVGVRASGSRGEHHLQTRSKF